MNTGSAFTRPNEDGGKDIAVYPPSALLALGRRADPLASLDPPTPQEIMEWQQSFIRDLKQDIVMWKTTANTIANVAAYLLWYSEHATPIDGVADGEIRIPIAKRREIGENLHLECGREGDEIVARYTLRSPDHHVATRGLE